MFFNSLSFAIFLPIVFCLYWILNKQLQWQNISLLISSYFFYACWDWRFLFLLIFSTLLDYFTGIKMEEAKNEAMKKFWFWLSIGVNLGFLGVFKYYNFFADSLAESLATVGIQTNFWTLKVILPVGISFYTFHGLSYLIDIYKGRIKAERNFIDYSVFVSFFPLLVAGPIERATHLLPQIQQKRVFNYTNAVDGMRQILWGLFKKMVVADNCAGYANQVFNDYQHQSASNLFLGAVYFSIQIYCDFSGYSDIALGTARLFGIELLRNFSYPYFSRDIAEFWRRWHMSLTTWFRDYLYIPLGGSQGGKWMKIRNTFIIFLVSGFWHGANWTFIAWGLINALYFLPLLLSDRNRNNLGHAAEDKLFPSINELFHILSTFVLTVFAWIFFRSETICDAFGYIRRIFDKSFFTLPSVGLTPIWFFVILLFFAEWIQRDKLHALRTMPKNTIVRWGIYFVLAWITYIFRGNSQQFIYFQF